MSSRRRAPSNAIRKNDRHRRAWCGLQQNAGELPRRGSGERLEKIALDQREHGLRLGIAEAAVELEHLRPVRGEHEACEEEPDERRPPALKLREHRAVDELNELRDSVLTQAGHRGVRAHAPGVRALVPIVRALEVLSRDQRDCVGAVAEREERDLRPFEQLLHHHAAAQRRHGPERNVELGL
jgi:hypothetical protein